MTIVIDALGHIAKTSMSKKPIYIVIYIYAFFRNLPLHDVTRTVNYDSNEIIVFIQYI